MAQTLGHSRSGQLSAPQQPVARLVAGARPTTTNMHFVTQPLGDWLLLYRVIIGRQQRASLWHFAKQVLRVPGLWHRVQV